MSTIRFCQECSNMLYPKENRHERILKFACRHCHYEEEAATAVVFRHDVGHSVTEQTQMISDVASDPTLPRTNTRPCPKCDHTEVVFFQSRARRPDTNMTLYYVCCNTPCGHRWVDMLEPHAKV